MKISINTKETLENPLSQIVGIVEKMQTLPILGNVYLHLEGTQLTMVGSDMETEITTKVGDISGVDGTITVSARKLYDICRSLPGESELLLSEDDGKMSIKAGRSRFSLQTLSADEYPRLEESNWQHEFSLTQQQLNALLTRTSFSMAQQDVRYFLNGLLFEIKNKHIYSVATDGHRMAKTEISVPHIDIEEIIQSIIPRKAVLEIARILDKRSEKTVDIKLNTSHIRVQSGSFTFISKLIDGRFPDYEKAIPANLDKKIIVDRQSLTNILTRAAILSNEKFRGVSLNISPGILKVSSHNPNQEHAEDDMPIDYQGQEIEIGFNVSYLIEALKACNSEKIELSFLDSATSCTFCAADSDDTVYLIMPMRL